MEIGIVSTGDELLRGAIADTNAAWMAARVFERGLMVRRVATVGDDLADLTRAFEGAIASFDLAIVTGGLGPTDDDLTSQAAAAAIGVRLARSDEAAIQVRAAFERIGRPMLDLNLKQADLPEGAQVLENPAGTAPGFALRTLRGRIVFLPGVPHEMRAMFERHVMPLLPETVRHRAVFKCFGMGESNIQDALRPVAKARPALRFGYRASFPEIGVSVTAKDAAALEEARVAVRAALGRAVFAQDDIDLPTALVRALAARGLTFGAAESCTGGLVGHCITEVPGASACFRGSVVAYDNAVKTGILGVAAAFIESRGAVSEEVARAMAEGARRALGADVGIGITGIAGPDGGSAEKPVGLVHMAVADSRGAAHRSHVWKGFDRARVKRAAAWTAMSMALGRISEDR
ncbi:MAG: CinA family nicotinamide mononucleotide deamidase-related protein [Deltaproteobacteria bacterium]|nr:CinA family nicotinamide mononucleotide deamidase-related protein [Deltaproteobacteria bacterium]